MRHALALVCVLAGAAEAAIPGARWISPPQHWRVGSSATALIVVGQDAIVGGWNGWIGRMDLGTGQVIRSTRIDPDFNIHYLAVLRDGRILATGERTGDRPAAMVIDPNTFAATSIAMPAHWRLSQPTVTTEGVVFAASDLPLALWDPTTWTVRRLLDTDLGWADVVAVPGGVIAAHDDQVYRVDLATTKRTPLGRGDDLAAGGNALARRVLEDVTVNKMGIEVDVRGKLAFRVDGRFANELAIDPSGTRLTVYDSDGGLEVFEIPSGKSLYKIALGHGGVSEVAVIGSRVVMAAGRAIRVLDTRDGSVTSTGIGPIDQPWSLTVDNAGAVAWFAYDNIYTFANGAITQFRVPDGARFVPPPGEVSRTAAGDNRLVTISKPADRSTVRTWKLEAMMSSGWFDGDRIAVETLDNGTTRRVVVSDGEDLRSAIAIEASGSVLDVDIQTDRALIGFDSTAWVVKPSDGTRGRPLAAPGCNPFNGQLEQRGTRLSLFDDHQIVLWDGASRYTTYFDDEIYRLDHVPKRDEVVIALERSVVLWAPKADTIRELDVPGVVGVAVSPDGKKLVLALADARATVVDLDTLRAALPHKPAETAAFPKCPVAKFAAVAP